MKVEGFGWEIDGRLIMEPNNPGKGAGDPLRHNLEKTTRKV